MVKDFFECPFSIPVNTILLYMEKPIYSRFHEVYLGRLKRENVLSIWAGESLRKTCKSRVLVNYLHEKPFLVIDVIF